MTKFLSKVFLSGILLSSVSGYCTVENPNKMNVTIDSSGHATLNVIDSKDINFDINVGDINGDNTIDTSSEPASLILSEGKTLKLNNTTENTKQTVTVYKFGKISGPSTGNGTIDLNGTNHSIVFHPGSTTSGNVTITSQPSGSDHSGIVDLSKYIKQDNNGNLLWNDSKSDLTLKLNNINVKLFGIRDVADYSGLFNSDDKIFNTITTNDSAGTASNPTESTVKILDVPNGVVVESEDGTTSYDSNNAEYNNCLIINKAAIDQTNLNKLFSLAANVNLKTDTIGSSGITFQTVATSTTGNAVIDFDSFATDGKVTINSGLKDIFGAVSSLSQDGGVTTSLFTKEYALSAGDNKDFNRIKTNKITEESGLTANSTVSVSNVTDYIDVTKYIPANDSINRTFKSSNIDFNGNNTKTSTLTLGDSNKTDKSSATTLNLTGTHAVTTTLSINNGSTINLKPGSTLTLSSAS